MIYLKNCSFGVKELSLTHSPIFSITSRVILLLVVAEKTTDLPQVTEKLDHIKCTSLCAF